jgi:hypothetical protein
MLPLNSEGEAPIRKYPWGSPNDDGEVLRNQEEIVRFGKTGSKPGRYAVVPNFSLRLKMECRADYPDSLMTRNLYHG